ncbi:MAG: c-type cytochrome [Gammaproteobacteria bacterium]|nr:c-type cytochrome [Gammaproteobacteria bacterium]
MKKTLLALVLAATTTGLSLNASALDVDTKYKQTCFACHGTGAAGAPKMGDKAAWAPRTAQGMATMLASVKNGKNAMPPGGLCMDCSDDDYKALINFMSK